MSSTNILENIAKHISLTEEEIALLNPFLTFREIPKKTQLFHAGQECRYLNFVDSGALRSYYIDKDGRESTIMFAIAGWWITDMYCFLNHKPAMM